MLILHYGYPVNLEYYSIDNEFKYRMDPKWMEDPIIPEIVKSIDGADQIAPGVFKSEKWGYMSCNDLAGGTKTIILAMFNPDNVYPLGNCGPNCAHGMHVAATKYDIQFSYRDYYFNQEPDTPMKVITEGFIKLKDSVQPYFYTTGKELFDAMQREGVRY